MEYGLIGEHLGHSFSKDIHGMLSADPYELVELEKDALEPFLRKADFKGINVTIPYKQAVMPFLDEVSAPARAIGAVNTIVNRDGRLCGYNTDYGGLRQMALDSGIEFKGRSVLVLGAGGAAKTAAAVAADLGAAGVTLSSRHPAPGQLSLETIAQQEHPGIHIIINATPVGMFPRNYGRVAPLDLFPDLQGVLDCVYNPLRTNLVLDAMERGIPAMGGLPMLVYQACLAREYFTGKSVDREVWDRILHRISSSKENIVLCGMPSSGKTTIGWLLAQQTGREVVDTDQLVRQYSGVEIADIFRTQGEAAFRQMETEAIASVAPSQGMIVSVGGGAVLNPQNVHLLKMNGRLVFIDRPLELLVPTSDRPLSSDMDKLKAMYSVRRPVYMSAADLVVLNDSTPQQCMNDILNSSVFKG
jgi:shikimate dehydrogenase